MNWPSEPQPQAAAPPAFAVAAAPVEPPLSAAGIPVDPLTAGLAPFGLLALLPLARRRTARFSTVLVVLVVLAGASLAVAACAPIPTPPPRPTRTPPGPPDTPTPRPSPTPRPRPTPPGQVETTTTIDYTYDPLYRLTGAAYDSGEFFEYSYDAVGNRLTQMSHLGDNAYVYDAANRLIEVDGVAYEWDAKGNLLSDGVSTFAYDHANRLIGVQQGADVFEFAYNGLGDRVSQTAGGETASYTLDLEAGLTQVLEDDESIYTYGLGRIGQDGPGGPQYFLGDALGSVRQLAHQGRGVTFAQAYEPFGDPLLAAGRDRTPYGFTGEWTDATGLVHLRARYYDPTVGRFFQRDPFDGIATMPASQNPYLYTFNNPVLFVDPSGQQASSSLGDISGYAEGWLFSISTGTFWLIEGREIVYDFHTMERGHFTVRQAYVPTGICLGLDVAFSNYFSLIFGFDPEGLVEDWEGLVLHGQAGLDMPLPLPHPELPILSVGAGFAAFISVSDRGGLPDFDVSGFDVYGAGSAGISFPFYLAVFMVETEFSHALQAYANDIERMERHITTGDGSPTVLPSPIREEGARWAREYHERQNR